MTGQTYDPLADDYDKDRAHIFTTNLHRVFGLSMAVDPDDEQAVLDVADMLHWIAQRIEDEGRLPGEYMPLVEDDGTQFGAVEVYDNVPGEYAHRTAAGIGAEQVSMQKLAEVLGRLGNTDEDDEDSDA